MPLQDGRRSKSIEEREEEYQRVRDRIFAREVSIEHGWRSKCLQCIFPHMSTAPVFTQSGLLRNVFLCDKLPQYQQLPSLSNLLYVLN